MSEYRIFVSSPSDVAIERTLVSSIVDRLRMKFGHRSKIKLILWEQYPLDAKDSFQPQLPEPADNELFLLILWRRIGTLLPDSALPPGFEGPLTGTEYEFIAAMKSQQQTGKPAIWVYRKVDRQIKHEDGQVEQFFNRHFTDADKRLAKAFHQFATTIEFEHQLETHLDAWFEEHLPKVSDDNLALSKTWASGNPFQGLKPFRFAQANVFRGRSAAIAESIEKLKSKASQGQPFLLITGMSGSGKSSLLRAGILPGLYTPQMVPAVRTFYRGIMRPADVQGNPFAGLVSALSADSADNVVLEKERKDMIRLGQQEPDEFITRLHTALGKRPQNSQLVLGIDQFEELYNSSSINVQKQRQFTHLIKRLVEQLNVWVIITMRSDCYHFLGDTPEILELKKEGGQLDLQPPELFNIRQMISEPAHLAGLQFEQGKNGEPPLNEVIAQSAAKSPESLPLLEFTLSQLYEARTASGTLTFSCYRALGGIEGAIASHAEHIFEKLSKPVQGCFPRVFNQLVNSTSDGRFVRRWASMNELGQDKNAQTLVDAFLQARLLVAERNPDEVEVVTLTHESLFRHWPRLRTYLDKNQKLIRLRNEVNEQVQRWGASGHDDALLLNAGKPLEDGKALLNSELSLDEEAREMIRLSIKRAGRNRMLQWSGIAALVMITVYATLASISASKSQHVAEQNLAKSQDLIEFLIGDLYSQLSELGRLDVMQSTGQKALDYFAELDPKHATNENIVNRSKALYQIGSVYIELNQYAPAVEAFSQSKELLSLLVEKQADNYAYLFEYSQAVYWVGYTYWAIKEFDEAQHYFEQYLNVGKQLVKLKPNDLSAKMEVSYAYSNLGTLAASQSQASLAKKWFHASIANSEAILKQDPTYEDALWSQADAYSWLGNAYRKQLQLTKALAYYRDEERIFKALLGKSYSYHNRYDLLLSTNRIQGVLSYLGQYRQALEGFYLLLNDIQRLVSHDPDNTRWRHTHAFLLADIAKNEFLLGNVDKSEQALIKSFDIAPGLPQEVEQIWIDEYAERHYWYWRLLVTQQEENDARRVAQQLMELDSKQAKLWKIRLISRTTEEIDVANIKAKSDINGPDALIAYFEYAVVRGNNKYSELIASYVPDEMWQNSELLALREQMDAGPIRVAGYQTSKH